MKTYEWDTTAAAKDSAYRRRLAAILLERRKQRPSMHPEAPGHVVEFLKTGRSTCGLLLWKGLRVYRILDTEGKVDNVHPAKIVDVSEAFVNTSLPRHKLLDTLRNIDRERERLKAAIDVHELWEVVEAEGHEWTLEELSALYFDEEPGPHGRAALFRILEEGHAFQRRGEKFVPLKPELVQEHREEERQRLRTDEWLHKAAMWLRGIANGQEMQPPYDTHRAIELLAAKVLFGNEHDRADQANALAKLAHFHTRQAIFDVLVKLGHWRKDENLDLLRHDIPIGFAEDAISEAERAEWQKRFRKCPSVWLRRVYSFSKGTSHYERAFSIRKGLWGFTVGVHFASPALLIRPQDNVQKVAADRAAVLHLPDRLIPLWPRAITDRASLVNEESRPCFTVNIRFNSHFKLKDYQFKIRRVRVNRPLSAQEADALMQEDRYLHRLHSLAKHLRQQRLTAGAVVINEPEVDIRVQNGEIVLHRQEPDSQVRLIEQELSILAGLLAGRKCLENGIPAIYRTEAPCKEILVDPDRFDPVASYRQKRLMPQATLQTQPGPHHGLGATVYVPINRPLDRYTDALMHQQMIALLEEGHSLYSEEELQQALLYTASARTTVREIESKTRLYWLLRYLEDKVGSELDAVVLDRVGNGYLVELTETRLRTFCKTRLATTLTPGAIVRVYLVQASARGGTFQLKLDV